MPYLRATALVVQERLSGKEDEWKEPVDIEHFAPGKRELLGGEGEGKGSLT